MTDAPTRDPERETAPQPAVSARDDRDERRIQRLVKAYTLAATCSPDEGAPVGSAFLRAAFGRPPDDAA